jgi:hypothetical protein
MSVFRSLVAIHYTLYLSAIALLAIIAVLCILLDYSLLRSVGYSALMVGGFWMSQGLAVLINRAMGFGGKSQSGSLD